MIKRYWSTLKSGLKWTFSLEDCSLDNILWHFRKMILLYGININGDFSHQEFYVASLIWMLPLYALSCVGLLNTVLVAERVESVAALSIFAGSFHTYFHTCWCFWFRQELTDLLRTAIHQQSSLTKVEELALHKEMRLAKWRCRTVFFVVTTNFVVFLLATPDLQHGQLPDVPLSFPGVNNPYETPYYQILYVARTTITVYLTEITVAFGIVFAGLLGHMVGHIRAIAAELKDLQTTAGEKPSEVENRLKYIVKRREDITVLVSKFRDLMSSAIGLETLCIAVGFVITLQAPSKQSLCFLVHLISVVFLFCYFGEYLMTASKDLERAIYHCGWEHMRTQDAKTVLLLLRNAQMPPMLTAFQVFDMSYASFMEFFRILYSASATIVRMN